MLDFHVFPKTHALEPRELNLKILRLLIYTKIANFVHGVA